MAARTSRPQSHALAYAGLAILFVLSVTHFARDGFARLDAVRHAGEYVREPFQLGDWNWGAVGLQPEAEAAGMKFADAVLSVNGRPIDGFYDYYSVLRGARVGDRLRVQAQVQYQGDTPVRDLSIQLQPYSSNQGAAGVSGYVDFAMRVVAMPVVCIALGFWVAAVRIRDRNAWLLLAMLVSLAAFVGGGSGAQSTFGRETIFQPLLTGFRVFLTSIAPVALMLFGIEFPERLALDRRFPFLKWIVVGYLGLVTVLMCIAVGLWVHHLAWARPLGRPVELLTGVEGDFSAGVNLFALVACIASLAWKTATSPKGDARRRLLLLDFAAVPSVLALVTLIVAGRWESSVPPWSTFPLMTMLLALPLTMAYGIVVERAMDVRVVIRQGLRYVLATRGVRVVQAAISIAIIVVAATAGADTSAFQRIVLMALGFALLAGLQGFAGWLRGWIDRRFFREAYEADAILGDLAAKVRTMVDTGPLLETVARRIAESLHTPRVAILLHQHGTFRPAYALGFAAAPSASISGQSLTVKRLRKHQHALVDFHDADSWVQLTDGEERASLDELKPALLLPLSLNEQVLGIMSLGPKQSEEPYSGADIKLLDSVASQTGLALENGRLTEAMKAEVAAREKQKRELEIAREVQERLFPQDFPPIAGLDYAGACRPALGVGGDYYDFIPLSKASLGIAIGDVSGKGIPAALLMATLRAFLRGQTMHEERDLTVMIANLNKLVYDSSAANRYATFFYAEFDATTRVLRYVNAGHNPPMLFRQSAIVRLDTGGPVIGLMEDCVYHQGCVALEAGDVLVAYTDGISEAMNAADDEWGEEELMNCVEASPTVGSRALIERLMIGADAFVAGAPQHDDMTLVVVRTI